MAAPEDRRRRLAAGTVMMAAALVLGRAQSAPALLGDTRGAVGVDGSVRSVALALDNYRFPLFFGGHDADFVSQTIARAVVAGHPLDTLSFEVHLVQSLDYRTSPGDLALAAGLGADGASSSRYRAVDLAWGQDDEGTTRSTLVADRLAMKLSVGRVDFTVGRQAVTYGKAYFWNPLDEFLAFDPRSFDRDYKPGVDALRVEVATGDFSAVELIGVAGREIDATTGSAGRDDAFDADWYGSALLLRGTASVAGWDLALQAGKVYGGVSAGAGAVGELGPVEARVEAVYLAATDERALPAPLAGRALADAFTGVVGIGHRFENTLTLEAEYLRNGQGDPDHLDVAALRFATGSSFHLSRNVVGLLAGYDILPIVVGQVAVIVSADDASLQIQPGLVWSVSDEVEAVFGAIVGVGDRPREPLPGVAELRSEFGAYPNAFYMEWKAYF